jgi:ornithine cyclodeaminase
MLLLSKRDIKRVFSMREAIEADKKAFQMHAEGRCVTPLRTNIQAPKYEGSFLFMPAYIEEMDTAALKIVNLFPQNINNGIPSSPAQVLLMDGKTGLITALLDGTYVTQLRTGGASGAAFDLLGREDAKEGALIGTGGQAASQLEAMIAAKKLDKVCIYDLNYERTFAFTQRMQKELEAYGTEFIAVTSSNDAIKNADLITTVTPSRKPVFDGSKVKAGATVSCVGSYQPYMQEMDPVILERAEKIYFDSEEAVLSEAGDFIIPLNEGRIKKSDFTGDLGDVILGKVTGRENDSEIIVFKTVGVATQDLITAKEIYNKAVEIGIGIQWE